VLFLNVQFWRTDVRILLRLQTKCFIRRSFLCAWKQSHSMSCTLVIHRKHHPHNLPPHCPLLNYNSHDANVIRSQMTAVKALILLLLNIQLYKSYFTVFPMATKYSDLFFSLFILHFMLYMQWRRKKGAWLGYRMKYCFFFLLFFFISKMPLDKHEMWWGHVITWCLMHWCCSQYTHTGGHSIRYICSTAH